MVTPKIINHPHGDRTFTSTLYYGADVRESLRTLPDQSVQCVLTSPPYWGLRSYLPEGSELKGSEIGLESTPDEYISAMADVFREVRRVLRDDGVLWLNVGDSYAGTPVGSFNGGGFKDGSTGGDFSGHATDSKINKLKASGLKPKDLVGIPWMLAFALRADGWYLRSDVIWAKGSCMPESVTDRPTRSHEYVFLLTKNQTYFYDANAISEESKNPTGFQYSGNWAEMRKHVEPELRVRVGNSRTETGTVPHFRSGHGERRNRRTVWTINPRPYKGAHFATMPPSLAELCVKAGSSEKGCCPTCGAPWVRVTTKIPGRVDETWGPTCECPEHEPVPCVILDPFSGSGTTGYVANRLGRHYVGTDLNPDYLPLAEARLTGMDPPEGDDEGTPEGEASILDLIG